MYGQKKMKKIHVCAKEDKKDICMGTHLNIQAFVVLEKCQRLSFSWDKCRRKGNPMLWHRSQISSVSFTQLLPLVDNGTALQSD